MTVEFPEGRPRNIDPALEEALRAGPFHTALQLAITNSGLTLERLEYHLQQRQHVIGRSTLSYWQQGRRRPERPTSLQALAALEEILGLPETSLSALLGPRKPRGRWIGYQGQGMDWSELWTTSEDFGRLTAIDSRRVAERSQEVAITESVDVGPDRRFRRLEIQLLMRARQQSADRYLFVFAADPGIDVSKMAFVDLEGCHPGRRRNMTNERLLALELLFDRSLAEGDTHFIRYTVDFAAAYVPGVDPVASTVGGRAFRRNVHNYIIRAQFDPAVLPVRCFHTRSTRTGSTEQFLDDLVISGQGTTHLAVQSVQPGVHRIRWDWE